MVVKTFAMPVNKWHSFPSGACLVTFYDTEMPDFKANASRESEVLQTY